jgi:hypothetical protein
MEVGGNRRTPAALPSGKTRSPIYMRLGGPQGRSGRMRKISSQPVLDPKTALPLSNLYTDWAFLAQNYYVFIYIYIIYTYGIICTHTHTHTHTHLYIYAYDPCRLLSLYICFPPSSPFSANVSRIPLHSLILSASRFSFPVGIHSASICDIYSATLHSVWVLSVSEVFSTCKEQNSLH